MLNQLALALHDGEDQPFTGRPRDGLHQSGPVAAYTHFTLGRCLSLGVWCGNTEHLRQRLTRCHVGPRIFSVIACFRQLVSESPDDEADDRPAERSHADNWRVGFRDNRIWNAQ